MKPHLENHLRLLLSGDIFFRQFWGRLSREGKAGYRCIWNDLEAVGSDSFLSLYCQRAHDEVRKWFLRIPEKDLAYSIVAADWRSFANDAVAKERLYESANQLLSKFLDRVPFAVKSYGGIKSDESIRRKIRDESAGKTVFGLWDIVRFRVVTPDLDALLKTSLLLWEDHLDQVARCRNFYFRPKDGLRDPYRAVHFELNQSDRVFEIQLMTSRREAISLLDHAFGFRKYLEFLDSEHEEWLLRLSMSANIADHQCIIGGRPVMV
ncbi:MAG: hypothetical protein ACLQPN_18560 [Bryobacteraceae bacterium]